MAFSDRPSSRGQPDAAPSRPRHAGKHAKSHHPGWLLVVPAVAVLAVLAGLAVFLARQSSQPLAPSTVAAAHAVRAPTDGAAAASSAAGASKAAATRKAVSEAVAACRQAWDAQNPALAAADRSLAQWQTHVQAMNALVAGRISFAQATRFWTRTRVGAMHRVRDFQRAYRALRRDPPSCSVPAGVQSTAGPAATLQACAQGLRVRNATLATAQRAIDTWHGHIRAMEMLRTGQMSPGTATRMWIRMWHRGQHQLDAYDSRASQAAAQHC